VEKDSVEYLPKNRAHNCKGEYEQVTFAFNDSIRPHLDERLEKRVLDKTWLPDVKVQSRSDDRPASGTQALQ
jgi:hypothetical protein